MAKDITTKYLGLNLMNPVVVSACPLTAELDAVTRMEALGAAAAVMPSLFEEQIEGTQTGTFRAPQINHEQVLESTAYYRRLDRYNRGPDAYLRQIESVKKAVSIPIFGSLNGTTVAGWVRYARLIQEAGADGLELNMYYVAADSATTTEEIESRYLELVAAVRSVISIPLAVKVGPFFAAFANMAKRLRTAGADGVVLFNRFLQPDVDLEKGKVSAHWRFSTPDDLYLPLRWVAILRGRVALSLAATGGIQSGKDLAKVLLAGADVGMLASVLYRHGIDVIEPILADLRNWLDASDFSSIEQLKGTLSQKNCPDPDEFERVVYAQALAETSEGTI